MSRTLVATLGFSMDFILKRVYDKSLHPVDEVVILALYTDEGSWRRIMDTYNLLDMTLGKAGLGVSLEKVEYGRGLIGHIRKILRRLIHTRPGKEVELFLTGGPRMLVVATLLAAASLGDDALRRITVTVYGENFEGTLTVGLYHMIVLGMLDRGSEAILHAIAKGVRKVKDLRDEVKMPKSTFYQKLSELEEHGFIRRIGRGEYSVREDLEDVI